MTMRLLFLAVSFAVASAALAAASHAEIVPPRQPLESFPLEIGDWHGRRAADLNRTVLAELGVDDYVNAIYRGANERSAIGLYIGYYESQRQGDTIHSPANCLPGAGWQPVDTRRLLIEQSNERSEINRWIIQNSDERQLVLYWYQSHGRVVASEYWNKFYLAFDAMRLNRTDGALIRVIAPIAGDSPAAVDEAQRHALAFVAEMFPLLNRFLPGRTS